MAKIRNWINIFLNEGFINVLRRLLSLIYQEYYLYECQLNQLKIEPKVCVIADMDILNNIDENRKSELGLSKVESLKKRIRANGLYIFIPFDDENNIAGYYCVDTSGEEQNKLLKNIIRKENDNMCYFFDDYTFDRYRGQGYHFQSILSRVSYFKKIGFDRAISIVYKDNQASRRSYEKAGFILSASLVEVGIGKNKFMFRTRRFEVR